MSKVIILAGMPGAGKGTISEMLKADPGISHISTGDLMRQMDQDSPLGRQIAEYQAKGLLLGDDIVNQVMESAFNSDKILLLDGYPRTAGQAEYTLQKAAEKGLDVSTILLRIDEDIATARRDERVRDAIAAGKEPRKDDADPKVLPKRFAEYREKTAPMLEYLREKLGVRFYDLDNRGTAEDMVSQIRNILT